MSFNCGLFLKGFHWEMAHFLSFSCESYFLPQSINLHFLCENTVFTCWPCWQWISLPLPLSPMGSPSVLYLIFSWIKPFRNYLPSNNPKLPLTCNTQAVPSFCCISCSIATGNIFYFLSFIFFQIYWDIIDILQWISFRCAV